MMEIETEILRKKRYRERRQTERDRKERQKDAQRTEMQREIDTRREAETENGVGEKKRQRKREANT